MPQGGQESEAARVVQQLEKKDPFPMEGDTHCSSGPTISLQICHINEVICLETLLSASMLCKLAALVRVQDQEQSTLPAIHISLSLKPRIEIQSNLWFRSLAKILSTSFTRMFFLFMLSSSSVST